MAHNHSRPGGRPTRPAGSSESMADNDEVRRLWSGKGVLLAVLGLLFVIGSGVVSFRYLVREAPEPQSPAPPPSVVSDAAQPAPTSPLGDSAQPWPSRPP